MNGFRGIPCSTSSCTKELKEVPDGSRRTRDHSVPESSALRAMARVKTFEMLWIENGRSASPALNTSPDVVATAIPKRSNGGDCKWGMLAGTDPASSGAGGSGQCHPVSGQAAVNRVLSSFLAQVLLLLAGPLLDMEQRDQ